VTGKNIPGNEPKLVQNEANDDAEKKDRLPRIQAILKVIGKIWYGQDVSRTLSRKGIV